jgi:hypothetical protein
MLPILGVETNISLFDSLNELFLHLFDCFGYLVILLDVSLLSREILKRVIILDFVLVRDIFQVFHFLIFPPRVCFAIKDIIFKLSCPSSVDLIAITA